MRLHVGQGTTVGAITVFPIWYDRTSRGPRRYATGTTALSITEAEDGPSVSQLVATNTGEVPVLVLDGQLFEGGWQHRMATRSTMVPARGRLVLDVVCVEQHRWHGERVQTTYGRRATPYVRSGFDAPGEQDEVWRRVDAYAGGTATGSLVDRLAVDDQQVRLVLRHTRPLAGQTGVLVGIGGHPVALEVFDHPDTMVEQLEPIIRAACLDALGRPALETPGRRARRMVRRLSAVRLDREPEVGQSSRLGRAVTPDLDVMALDHLARTVHLRATNRRHPMLVGAGQ